LIWPPQKLKHSRFQEIATCVKARIEKAAKLDGVSKADWNKETKEMNVTFNDVKTNLESVQVAITKVGHDTNAIKATDEAYNELPSCCNYDRSDLKAPMKPMEHKHQ